MTPPIIRLKLSQGACTRSVHPGPRPGQYLGLGSEPGPGPGAQTGPLLASVCGNKGAACSSLCDVVFSEDTSSPTTFH